MNGKCMKTGSRQTVKNVLTVLLTSVVHTMVAQAPNIVLIVTDDHGLDALGCYGNPVIKTPALDAFANDGTRFTHLLLRPVVVRAGR